MANHFSILPWEPHEQYEKAKRTLKDELPRSIEAQYPTGEVWRKTSSKNKEMEPEQKQCIIIDVSGGESKVQYYKNNSV